MFKNLVLMLFICLSYSEIMSQNLPQDINIDEDLVFLDSFFTVNDFVIYDFKLEYPDIVINSKECEVIIINLKDLNFEATKVVEDRSETNLVLYSQNDSIWARCSNIGEMRDNISIRILSNFDKYSYIIPFFKKINAEYNYE